MTENKRYSFNWKNGHPNFWDNHCDLADCYLTCGDVVNILNELNDENEQLKIFLKAVNEELDLANRDCDILEEENEQLKQRNNRQYEQLGRLYDLIEQKKWRVLTDIIDDFKKSDEQLQKEWGTYGDVE